MASTIKDHWENIFANKNETEFSWFQEYPKRSMELLERFHLPLNAAIIDIGGGDSHFIDALLEKGYQNAYVLDISENALSRAKERLGEKGRKVHWIISDVTDFVAPVQFDLWHDMAAFHFLTTPERIDQYVRIAENAIRPGGYLILGTFSENGPGRCSGLEIKQYSQASLSARFENEFKRIRCVTEVHLTPAHARQNFLFCSFLKK